MELTPAITPSRPGLYPSGRAIFETVMLSPSRGPKRPQNPCFPRRDVVIADQIVKLPARLQAIQQRAAPAVAGKSPQGRLGGESTRPKSRHRKENQSKT